MISSESFEILWGSWFTVIELSITIYLLTSNRKISDNTMAAPHYGPQQVRVHYRVPFSMTLTFYQLPVFIFSWSFLEFFFCAFAVKIMQYSIHSFSRAIRSTDLPPKTILVLVDFVIALNEANRQDIVYIKYFFIYSCFFFVTVTRLVPLFISDNVISAITGVQHGYPCYLS